MLVVGVILLCIAGITIPMVTRVPGRVERENALGELRRAFSEVSMRARANGVPLSLTLVWEENTFYLSRVEKSLPPAAYKWIPDVPASEEREETLDSAISVKSAYELPSSISWQIGGEDDGVFVFFEDGQASGTPLQFAIGEIRYQLDVDALTGDALIEELQEL